MGIPTPDSDNVGLCFFIEAFAMMIMMINIVRIMLMIDGKKSRDISGVVVGGAYATS